MFIVNWIQDQSGNLFEISISINPRGKKVITIKPL
jgi:hypothetical protein